MKYGKRILACLLLTAALGTPWPLMAQGDGSPADGSRLQRLDAYLQKVKAKVPTPGFAMVVVKGDEIVFAKGYGVAVAGEPAPMTVNTSTSIGSMTKAFTALAVMQLVEQGKLKLDEPVVKYLPWFRTINKAQSDKITVRMLLSNTSGMPSRDLFDTTNRLDYSMEKIVRGLSSCALSTDPGTAFEYSNDAFCVAGLLIEKLSGMKYEDYLQERILKPLAMDRSTSDYRQFDRLHVLYGHVFDQDKAIPAKKRLVVAYLAAGSEMRCSAENFGHYLIALMNDGWYKGRRVISGRSIAEMWTPRISFPGYAKDMGYEGKDWQYGLGWIMARIAGENLIVHGGEALTMNSFTAIDPAKKLAVCLLSNAGSLDPFRFVTKETVVCNTLCILQGKPLANVGVPTKRDPSITGFVLPKNLRTSYTGEYISKGGYAKVNITADRQGRMLLAANSAFYPNYSEIVFQNRSQAYLKNLSGNIAATFKLTAKGEVTGIDIPGLYGSYNKTDPAAKADYHKTTSPNGKISFIIPENLVAVWRGSSLTIKSSAQRDLAITGGIIDQNEATMEVLMQQGLKGKALFFEGDELDDTVSGFMWKQKSLIILSRGVKRHLLILTTMLDEGNVLYLCVTCDFGNLSAAVKDAVIPLMDGLAVR